jgi:MFS family permease
MTTYWEFLLYFGVISSLGLAATGHVVASAILTRWFERRRGTAMSLLGAAGMAGMSVLVPVVMWCILTIGWRESLLLMAAATFVLVLPLALLVVRDRPEDLGLHPDGAAASTVSTAPARDRTTIAAALRVPAFWQLAIGLACCGFSMSLVSSHALPMLTDHGFHPMTASSAIGLLGLVSIGGGMTLGFISDRVGRRPVLVAVYVLRTAAFILLFFAADPAVLMVVAAFGGIGMSGSLAMVSALTADIFGRFSVGSIFGTMFLAHQVGAALGAWLGGALFDATGGYGAAFATAGGLLLFAAGLSLAVRRGRPRPDRVGPPLVSGAVPRPVAGGR